MGPSCREYIFHSSELLKSILPSSTSLREDESMGWGRPMDSRYATAANTNVSSYPAQKSHTVTREVVFGV